MASVKDEEVTESGGLRKRHDILKMYYGVPAEGAADSGVTTIDPCDINGPHFKPDIFLTKLLKERSLTELMDKETEMVRHIRSLDSDMQTLVYENYNKFISATDTIRKMKNDFRKMEEEMDHLTANMSAITDFSARISNTLQDRRHQITKLSGVHTLLKKLQFLFELPSRLEKCIEMQAYSQAVRYYTKARKVLHQYEHMPSFQGIQHDCNLIVQQLSIKLREQFRDKDSSAKQLAECVDLLLQLNEPAEVLCEEFLSHAQHKIDEDLSVLEDQLKLLAGETPGGPLAQQTKGSETDGTRRASATEVARRASATEVTRRASAVCVAPAPMDVLEFVDCGCNGFLSNVCLVIASYNDMFLNRQTEDDALDAIALKKLVNFVNGVMEKYFNYVQRRVLSEKESGDNTILVRALDRFHRRLQAMNKLLPDTDFSRAGIEIVSRAARDRVTHYSDTLKQHFSDCLTDIRQNLAAPRFVGKHEGGGANLADLLHGLQTSVVDQIKSVLTNLQAFIASDVTFAMKPYFRGPFCNQDVRQGLVVGFIQHIMFVCNDFCENMGDKSSVPPSLLLILARLCSDLEESTILYLMTLAEEQFIFDGQMRMTQPGQLCSEAKDMAQKLLNHYVRVQGQTMSQMLRKSVETRDWLNTIEPRNVRAVMKRVVEDITAIDSQVGQLYEEGVRKEQSSDSTKRSYSTSKPSARTTWSFTPSTLDNNLLSNIQKLFSERIEIFSAVQFSKVSILTGIIKISLKTFLECVRLRTFGRYGLQQIQVDTHYLQLYLWRFVSDENLVHFLLDEIVGSTVHRCLEPTTMEPSVSANAKNMELLLKQIDFQVENDPIGLPRTNVLPCDHLVTGSFSTRQQGVGFTDIVVQKEEITADLDLAFLKITNWGEGQGQDDCSITLDVIEETPMNITGNLPDKVSVDNLGPGPSNLDLGFCSNASDDILPGRSTLNLDYKADLFGSVLNQTQDEGNIAELFQPCNNDATGSLYVDDISADQYPRDDLEHMFMYPLVDKIRTTWQELLHKIQERNNLSDLCDNECILISDDESQSSADSYDRLDDMAALMDDYVVMNPKRKTAADSCCIN